MAIEHAELFGPQRAERADSARAAANTAPGLGELANVAFETALDSVNPLQQLPGVSSVYRAATGDSINPLARAAGGFIFGGPIGAGIGLATGILEMLTGQDPMDHAMALLQGASDKNAVASGHVENPAAETGDALLANEGEVADGQMRNLSAAQYERRPGFGADRKTVELSSNAWLNQTMAQVSGMYEQAQSLQSDAGRARHSRSA